MRSLEEIYQELAAEFQEKTGLSAAGSGDLAARFYAVAAQLSGLYVQADWTRRQCFPQTAEGEELDKHGWLRGVTRQPAVKAKGTVRFYADSDHPARVDIPAGTVCMTAAGLRFVTVEKGSIPVGETFGDAAAEAVEAGLSGNTAADTILFLAVPPVGVTACGNPEGFTGGEDAESDEELRGRVLATYQRLANGANSAFYQQTAMSFDGVEAVTVIPRSRGVGTVDLVVASREGMPDEELLEQLRSHFNSVREIAVDVDVLAPTAKAVDVAVTLSVKPGTDFSAVRGLVESTVTGWFTGQRLGQPVLRAELTALIFGVDGVANCAVTAPAADLAADGAVLPVLGSLSVTEG